MLPGVETLLTLRTGIEFQACVDSDVTKSPSFLTEGFSTLDFYRAFHHYGLFYEQQGLIPEASLTNSLLIGFLSRVGSLTNGQTTSLTRVFLAVLALIGWLLSWVYSLMCNKIALGPEAVSPIGTLKRLWTSLDSLVQG